MRALIRRWLGSARPAAWDLSAYPPSPRPHPGHGAVLSPAQAQDLYQKLLALYREYDALAKTPGAEGDFYALVASTYPTTAQQVAPGPKPRMRARPTAE